MDPATDTPIQKLQKDLQALLYSIRHDVKGLSDLAEFSGHVKLKELAESLDKICTGIAGVCVKLKRPKAQPTLGDYIARVRLCFPELNKGMTHGLASQAMSRGKLLGQIGQKQGKKGKAEAQKKTEQKKTG